jgi:hypothetical protein
MVSGFVGVGASSEVTVMSSRRRTRMANASQADEGEKRRKSV